MNIETLQSYIGKDIFGVFKGQKISKKRVYGFEINRSCVKILVEDKGSDYPFCALGDIGTHAFWTEAEAMKELERRKGK